MGELIAAVAELDDLSKRYTDQHPEIGKRSAQIAYYLGRSQVGEFAFAASEREKEASEEYLLKAVEMDPGMPEPYKALGELYGEWEMYGESAAMYKKYLKVVPKSADRSRVERQIDKMERKAR